MPTPSRAACTANARSSTTMAPLSRTPNRRPASAKSQSLLDEWPGHRHGLHWWEARSCGAVGMPWSRDIAPSRDHELSQRTAEGESDHLLLDELAQADRSAEARDDRVDHRIFQGDVDRHLRMVVGRPTQDRRFAPMRRARIRTMPVASRLVLRASSNASSMSRSKARSCRTELARLGRRHATGGAMQERFAQPVLQTADRLAYRRPRKPEHESAFLQVEMTHEHEAGRAVAAAIAGFGQRHRRDQQHRRACRLCRHQPLQHRRSPHGRPSRTNRSRSMEAGSPGSSRSHRPIVRRRTNGRHRSALRSTTLWRRHVASGAAGARTRSRERPASGAPV